MKYLFYVLAGLSGGLLGGMGMGGGTLLIPILCIFLEVKQITAQTVNLVAFIPMAVVALIIHFKNKMVDTKGILYMIIPATFTGVGSVFLAQLVGSKILSRIFGGFLILFAFVEFFLGIKKLKNDKKTQKNR